MDTVFPGGCLFLLVFSVNVLGDWLRDRLDPRSRSREVRHGVPGQEASWSRARPACSAAGSPRPSRARARSSACRTTAATPSRPLARELGLDAVARARCTRPSSPTRPRSWISPDRVRERLGRAGHRRQQRRALSRRAASSTYRAADWDRIFDVNLRAPFLVSREMARLMIERGMRGSIVNISLGRRPPDARRLGALLHLEDGAGAPVQGPCPRARAARHPRQRWSSRALRPAAS